LDFFGRPIVVGPSHRQLSGDTGLVPVRQFDERIGLTPAFANALDDPRAPGLAEHSFLEMVRSRVYGILAGYVDQNDHDTLRSDPVFKLSADRSPEDDDLASQPTLSRFENAISIKSLKRLRDVFVDQFIASFDTPPRHLTFDLDAIDDPAHGQQQLTFWHGYYDQNQYLPLVLTCADNDQFVMLSLRPGNVHAALGADDDVAYLVSRLRRAWPDMALHFRGNCGFGVPAMYEACEGLRVSYTFGLSGSATSGCGGNATRWGKATPALGVPCSSRWRRKSPSGRGGLWHACPRAGRTSAGFAGCASACAIPSRRLSPILPVNPLDSLSPCLPRMGGRGRCVPGADPGRSSVTNGPDAPGWQPCEQGVE
jgi:hypothetical protein